MKKKLICLFLALVMMFACASVLASCGGDTGSGECDHYDDNKSPASRKSNSAKP